MLKTWTSEKCKRLAPTWPKLEPKEVKKLVLVRPKSEPTKKKEESDLTSPKPELK